MYGLNTRNKPPMMKIQIVALENGLGSKLYEIDYCDFEINLYMRRYTFIQTSL